MIGRIIGQFKLVERLGGGGQAEVYRGVHERLEKIQRAFKILKDPKDIQFFRSEAEKLADLQASKTHKNICNIVNIYREEDCYAIELEFVDGITLDEYVKSKKHLEVKEAASITCQVLSALDFALQHEIYHRDIKPSNIMVEPDGTIKVIDFGIAKNLSDTSVTMPGVFIGTYRYASPERIDRNMFENCPPPLTDQYSTGSVLYFMLTGVPPFPQNETISLIREKLHGDPPPPRSHYPDIPVSMEKITLKSISRDPSDRFSSHAQMKRAIEDYYIEGIEFDSDSTEKKTVEPPVSKDVEPEPVRPEPVDATTFNDDSYAPIPHEPPKPNGTPKAPLIALSIAVSAMLLFGLWHFLLRPWLNPDEIGYPLRISPSLDETINTSRVVFAWQPTDDRSHSFTIRYSTTASFMSAEYLYDIADTFCTAADTFANGTYYWQVSASSLDGKASEFSPTGRFRVTLPRREEPDSVPDDGIEDTDDADGRTDGQTGGQTDDQADVQADDQTGGQGSEGTTTIDTVQTTHSGTGTGNIVVPALPDSGRVTVACADVIGEIKVYINNEVQEYQPPYTFTLPVGNHEICLAAAIYADGITTRCKNIVVAKGSEELALFKLRDSDD